MRITYDYQIFSKQRYGGISRYFHEIASIIPSIDGDYVEIFAPLYVNEYIGSSKATAVNGTKFSPNKFTKLAVKFVNVSVTCLRNRTKRNTDIFHETYYSMLDCAPRSAKRVITVYDMIHERFPDLFSRYDVTHRAKRSALQRADHIICISENTRHDLIEATNIPIEKTSVVHLGYSLITNPRSSPSLVPEAPYLLYVGARGGYKNFEGLLEAYSRSNLHAEFSLVCFGGGSVTSRESSLIHSLGIKPGKVVFLSGCDSLLSSLYVSASAFVYPSKYEGFGIPPLEAMSFGCPVVCSNTSSMPEVVGDAAELFDPHDPEGLREALEQVLSSPDRLRQLAALGHERIKLFSWEKCARETLDAYKHILQS
ncbi:glycosyltransferase family 1 protein [Rhodanobacter sp. OK091]|uniref:glycosyltransferase family 4 protein n=1 Tax=Rhodanobacter sp. OK091 TaxID=1881037 RepID=UPI000934F80D|nr:glycosyltransferase family 1 protein [Rhodanobacter sp. OK091]